MQVGHQGRHGFARIQLQVFGAMQGRAVMAEAAVVEGVELVAFEQRGAVVVLARAHHHEFLQHIVFGLAAGKQQGAGFAGAEVGARGQVQPDGAAFAPGPA
jgi:hypothetical protein